MTFQSGREKTGGRKAGTPNKHTQAVKDALRAALEASHEDGAEGYFLRLSRDDPKTFMGAVQKLIPTEVESKVETKNTITVRRFSSGREKESRRERR